VCCLLAAVTVRASESQNPILVRAAPPHTPFTPPPPISKVPCQFTPTSGVASGHTFDLTELQGQIFAASDLNYVYKMAVCGVNPEPSCILAGGGLCQYTAQNHMFVHSLMSWTSNQQPIWNLIEPKDKNSGLTLQFANGDSCFNLGSRVLRVVNLNFPCSQHEGRGNGFSIANSVLSPCVYNVNFPTAVTCFDYVPASGGQLSAAAIFIILLVVVVPVYVAGGCLYKRRKLGVSGMEACPNVGFWQQLPSYAKEGGHAVYHKVRYCGRDTSDGDI